MPRRHFLQSAAGTAIAGVAVPAVPAPVAAAAPQDAAERTARLRFTATTNGAATPARQRFLAEVQNVLWSFADDGRPAIALTPPDLEPTRPAVSPDGRQVAMACFKGGQFHIWVMAVDGTGLRRLTEGPWDDRGPAWSPDGSKIVFSSERGGDPVKGSPYRIWTVDPHGGKLTQLTGLKGQSGPGQDVPYEDFDPTWSADGSRIVFVRGSLDQTVLRSRTLAAVPAVGGPVTVWHAESEPGNLQVPVFSPAGRSAWLRTVQLVGKFEQVILVVDGKPVPVDGEIAVAPPRWLDEERLLLTVDGQFQIVRARTGGSGHVLPFDATLPVERPSYRVKKYDFEPRGTRKVRGIQQPALAPDGRSFAFVSLNTLWIQPMSSSGKPRKVVRAPAGSYVQGPTWSRDGRSLLYVDDRDGLNAVRRHDLATGKDTVLAPGGRVHGALSPDGTRLACLDMAGNLLVRDLGSGTEKVLAAPMGGGGLPGPPSWSPDGRYVAYCDRNRLNLRFREGYNLIRVVDVTTGADRLHPLAPFASLSDRYASGPAWSPDGKWFACVSESALWVLPVRPDGTPHGEPRRLGDEGADHPSWSADSTSVLHLADGKVTLTPIDGGGGRTVPVRVSYRRSTPVDTLVHAGQLWDGTGSRPRDDIDILIRDGRVAAVEPHRAGRRATRFIDASDRTVLPGLWDAHTHPWQYTYGARQSALELAYGVTTTVSLAGFSYEQARLREDVIAGRLAGPRLLTTGELLDGPRVAYSMGRAHRTPEGLRRSFARGAALDWDFVKTYVRAPFAYMAAAARFGHDRLGVRSGSHLCSQGVQSGQDLTTHLSATERTEYGHGATSGNRTHQDTRENYTHGRFNLVATPFSALPAIHDHPDLVDDPRVTEMMPPWDLATVRAQAAKVPTDAERLILRRELASYRMVVKEGGLMAIGTDTPLTPVGLHLHLSLRELVAHGFSPTEALLSVTAAPARVFGAERDLGSVTAGKLGDLTIVDGDPFTDFAALVRVTQVLVGGRLHERAELAAPYKKTKAPRDRAPGAPDWRAVGEQMRRDGCCE
ncbi:LpqB family beta-propeller domain-containing protein [Streptomyces sp. NPDC005904]|uniref:amidohydrolase family protein n=1 Tax=Streptomyces sp. NPDC005904 TaxID=3154570 RepID=UPI003401D688